MSEDTAFQRLEAMIKKVLSPVREKKVWGQVDERRAKIAEVVVAAT